MPVHRVVSALVFNVTPRDVRDVIVDGRILMRSRRLTSIDERDVLRRAEQAAAELFRRAGVPSRLT
jgi:5-methylthioadenosine/S-adenosylhomocysteine deaminase